MKYVSTRNSTQTFTLSEAMLHGLAPDGGLFVPQVMPKVNFQDFIAITTYPLLCQKILEPFFVDDILAPQLETLCQQAFNFPVPITQLNETTYVLELFHGPTLSFKDFGARFLASCLNARTKKKLTIMVATSGDTGSAVAAAFYKMTNIDVIVLFPENKISAMQQQQITCWDENVRAFAVSGTFDDCQRLVKQAFSDPWWQTHRQLCTANSINIGRLLPQICYYAFASLEFYKQKKNFIKFVVPSGNLGNVTAAFWAKKMGFPIDKIVIATNANKVLPDYLASGNYLPRPSITTLANAMDVGNPSNFERLLYLFPEFSNFKTEVTGYSVSDEEIKQTIKQLFQSLNLTICPHTATAYKVRTQLSNAPTMIVSTAHPCKFDTVIEPIIQQAILPHPSLKEMMNRKSHYTKIKTDLSSINQFLK